MDKKTWGIIGVIVVIFAVVIGISVWQGSGKSDFVNVDEIEHDLLEVDYSSYPANKIVKADEFTGGLEENIEGDPNAPVLIFEYADYQCEGCAAWNPYMNKLLEEYEGKVALVFRTYIMSYHQNGQSSASAANAAGLQGYWREYSNLLYTNQDDWYSVSAMRRQELFEQYFEEVSDGKGDMEKFRADMQSDAVAQKIAFDRGMAEKVNLDWTPTIFVGDTLVEREQMNNSFMDTMRSLIDAELEKKGIK